MFGFYGSKKGVGHHSGGRTLHEWAMQNQIKPLDLHLGWVEDVDCHRCLEVHLHDRLRPALNRATPSRERLISRRRTMSALPPIADIDQTIADVRFVPKADIGNFIGLQLNIKMRGDIAAVTRPAARRTGLFEYFY